MSAEQDIHKGGGEPERTIHAARPLQDEPQGPLPGYSDDEKDDEQHPLIASTNSTAFVNLTTNGQSMMHLLKGNMGTGILAMASAINNAGLWTGFVGLFVLGSICIHCMHLLVGSSHKLCARTGRSHLDYGEVAEEACKNSTGPLRNYGRVAKIIVNVFLCITQLGFCIVYVLFVAENIKQVVETYADVRWVPQIYMCFLLFLLVPYVFVRKLKHLAPFSTIANVITIVGLVIILQYCFQNLKPYYYYPAFSSWGKLPLFFGTAIYAFEGIGVVLPIENKMRTPHDFGGLTGVLNTGMVIVTVLYVAVGFFGYLTFGSYSQGSITLDLPSTHWLYVGVKLLFSVAIFLTYGIQFYVPAHLIVTIIKDLLPRANPKLVDYGLRVALVLFTFGLAALIPHLDLMISLVGALSSSTLAIIFPPILDTMVIWPELGYAKWKLFKNILLCIIGIVGFVTGTFISIVEIIKAF